jgi:glycosyltransferase involved in cell wall biosynthesis
MATPTVLIALTSLCAEGTPVLVLDLCRQWLAWGIQPVVVTLYDQPRDLEPELRSLRVPLHELTLPAHGYQRYAQLAAGIYRLVRRYRAQAFLSMPFGWHTFMAAGARLAGVRRVAAHVGNYPPVGSPSFSKFRQQVQWGRSLTDRLLCCSAYIQSGVIQHFGVPEAETQVVYNGCAWEPERDRPRPGQPLRIGMVARLEGHKDQPTLIRAAAVLKRQGIPIQVQLIGDGRRRAEYQALIAQLGVEDCVSLLGMRRDIPDLLQHMDVFVFSAKPDEGFGIALVEAMVMGVPVVATQVGACCEVLQDGDLGWLVPPGDAERLAAAIRYVATHPDQAQIVAQRAQEVACTAFSMAAMARDYALVLDILPDQLPHERRSTSRPHPRPQWASAGRQ